MPDATQASSNPGIFGGISDVIKSIGSAGSSYYNSVATVAQAKAQQAQSLAASQIQAQNAFLQTTLSSKTTVYVVFGVVAVVVAMMLFENK